MTLKASLPAQPEPAASIRPAALLDALAVLQGRVDVLTAGWVTQSEFDALAAQVTDLEAQMASRVGALETQVASLQSQVASLQAQVAGLQSFDTSLADHQHALATWRQVGPMVIPASRTVRTTVTR